MQFTELAFWCDVRGDLGISDLYTGNVGCYWHIPYRKDLAPDERADLLAEPTTEQGKARVADVYRALKTAEIERREIRWSGLQSHVLPVNLVPYAHSLLDLGSGQAGFVRMLTRNVHGLRISRVATNDGFLVESCLPRTTNRSLVETLKSKGMLNDRCDEVT